MSTETVAWQRLSPRMIAVNLRWLAAPVAAVGATSAFADKWDLRAYLSVGSVAGVFLVIVGIGVMRAVTTRYLITQQRVELRKGLLFRSHRSVPRDRIRSVDLTANPLHRVFGLSTVKIGTGQHGSSQDRDLTLDGVAKVQALQLRQKLLSRNGIVPVEESDNAISRLDWAWLRYAPLTIWGVVGVFAVLGSIYRPLHEMGLEPWKLAFVQGAADQFSSVPLWLGILVLALAVVLLGVVGSVATFIEGWWGFRLEREPGGTFRVRRGLLITRSVSFEESRLRGVEVAEPLLLRWAGGARTYAVALGLGSQQDSESSTSSALLPPAPRSEALRVAAEVLALQQSPTSAVRLRSHPRVALRRRLVRGLVPVALLVGILAGLGAWLTPVLLHCAWVCALLLFPAVVLLAIDAYRGLGHGVSGDYLVTRSGAFARRTVALRRSGVLGWTVSRSFFQRRAGLCTLSALTAAGGGAYRIRDVEVSQALAFAKEAVPGLLTPLTEPRSTSSVPLHAEMAVRLASS